VRDDIEVRPLRADDDSGLFEEGRCVGCGDPLPSPLNTRRGQRVRASVLFHNAPGPEREDQWLGLGPCCMRDVAALVDAQPGGLR
jgi:hypothetical protein